MPSLSSKRRSELRSEAHKLVPVVIIGDKGLTDEVLAEIDRALNAHELIKVRAATDDRDARHAWMESICAKLSAHEVQQIGKVLVVYRENPEKKPEKNRIPRRRRAAVPGTTARRRRVEARRYLTSTISNSFTPPGVRPRRRRPNTSR